MIPMENNLSTIVRSHPCEISSLVPNRDNIQASEQERDIHLSQQVVQSSWNQAKRPMTAAAVKRQTATSNI